MLLYDCKTRFNYTYCWTCNITLQNIILAYCEGRSALWRMFFGWRKTTCKDQMFFWLPTKKIESLIALAEEIA